MTNKAEKIGVLGAGTMGAGIAQVAAQAGFETQLYDISQEFIDNGLGRIRSFLKGSRERGKITAEVEKEILDRLRSTTKLEDFRGYSLIIEAAPEKLELKQTYSSSWIPFAARKRSSPPTHRRFPSQPSPRARNIRNEFSACTSSIRRR